MNQEDGPIKIPNQGWQVQVENSPNRVMCSAADAAMIIYFIRPVFSDFDPAKPPVMAPVSLSEDGSEMITLLAITRGAVEVALAFEFE